MLIYLLRHSWIIACLCFPLAHADDAQSAGKSLVFERSKGNCIACHAIEDGEFPGNWGPPLLGMAQRYPDKGALRTQIWDATAANPNTAMPPFGRHGILTEAEIDQIVAYIYSL